MSKKEKTERGFNQTEELAQEIKKLGNREVEVSYNLLKKVRETARQTGLNRDEREKNLKESMTADSHKINNRVVVVLDDVYTTGASLSEARRALTANGAKRVIGLFIAH